MKLVCVIVIGGIGAILDKKPLGPAFIFGMLSYLAGLYVATH